MTAKPIFLNYATSIALQTPIAQDRLEKGQPLSGMLSAYENTEKSFFVGQWSAQAGRWRVSYSEDELCVILEGSGALIGEDGTRYPFKKGDAFVIPAGFIGQWQNDETIRKIYAIVE